MAGYADPSPTYQPAMRLIIALSNNADASIRTSFAHDYQSGLIVRIVVPEGFGMRQIDKKVGIITVTGDDTFTINIDSSNFDTFVFPDPVPYYINEYPMVLPIGQINSQLVQATRNVL